MNASKKPLIIVAITSVIVVQFSLPPPMPNGTWARHSAMANLRK